MTEPAGNVITFPGIVARQQARKRCELCEHSRAEYSTWTAATHLYCHADPARVHLVDRGHCCRCFDWRKVVS